MISLVRFQLGFLIFTTCKWNNNVSIVPTCMLTDLSLRFCSVKGPIPLWFSNQTELTFLDLSENELKGTYPQWLVELNLGAVVLSDKKLTGSLPPTSFESRN